MNDFDECLKLPTSTLLEDNAANTGGESEYRNADSFYENSENGGSVMNDLNAGCCHGSKK